MPTPRIFQHIPLTEGKVIELTLDAAHYLGNVRRAREGDALVIFNGEGGEYKAHIIAVKKEKLTIKIGSYQPINVESKLSIHLAQGIARGEKMDFIVQKAVELGVKKIIPLFTERSSVKLDANKRVKRQQHWQAVAISACEQSGRNLVPDVSLPLTITEWLAKFQGLGILLSPRGEKKISELEMSGDTSITFLIGPEGGLNEEEVGHALSKKFISVKLGPRVLRTETASLAAITALQCRWGDMG